MSEAAKPRETELPLSAEEVKQALERVLQSSSFQRSERLQRFLRFVCDYTVRGEGHLLHEYLIGSEVFGRGPEYSPHEDGIVRRQAHALRRKLQEYYDKDGAGDPVRIELPVGRYVPMFRRHAEAAPALATDPASAASVLAEVDGRDALWSKKLGGFLWVFLVIGGIGLFATGVFIGARTKKAEVAPPATVSPEEREIWGAWLDRADGATICFSNPLTTVVKHYQEQLDPASKPPRQLMTPRQEKFFRSVVSIPPGGYLYFAPAVSQTKMGEAFAAVYLTSLFSRSGRSIKVTQSRFVTWEDLTRENIIFFGHNEANPWLDRILQNYPFQLVATKSKTQRAIVNSRPAAGEPEAYQIRYGDEVLTATEEYALISMLPGADARHLLLGISGLNTQATQSAAEFLTAPARLRELVAALKKIEPSHSGHWYFQAVLRTEVHDKVPTKAALVSLKVIKP
jgi:hypothetical protein